MVDRLPIFINDQKVSKKRERETETEEGGERVGKRQRGGWWVVGGFVRGFYVSVHKQQSKIPKFASIYKV